MLRIHWYTSACLPKSQCSSSFQDSWQNHWSIGKPRRSSDSTPSRDSHLQRAQPHQTVGKREKTPSLVGVSHCCDLAKITQSTTNEELILRDAFLNYIIMSLCDVFVFWSMHKQLVPLTAKSEICFTSPPPGRRRAPNQRCRYGVYIKARSTPLINKVLDSWKFGFWKKTSGTFMQIWFLNLKMWFRRSNGRQPRDGFPGIQVDLRRMRPERPSQFFVPHGLSTLDRRKWWKVKVRIG